MMGTTLSGRYEITGELGRGGMGVVYLARDPLLERRVAIKLVTPNLMSPDGVERFKREARVVAGMDHPAIVGVHDIGEHDGSLYYVMPLIDGSNLRSLMREGSLRLVDVIEIGVQVSDALEYSHARGVVHRDIKPENLLVTRPSPGSIRLRITDFGLAITSTSHRLTKTGAVVGTIAYLSPEQVSGDEVDGRSDIYSLATVLYECLVGEPPFGGEVQAVLYRIAHENPEPPRSSGIEIGEELEVVLMQCLEKDPARRPSRAAQVAQALTRCAQVMRERPEQAAMPAIHRPTVQSRRPSLAPFAGREREMAELQRRLNAALTGGCQFAIVSGDAGVGKTRLLEELESLAKARSIRVLRGHFVERDQAFPYYGFCEALQDFFRTRKPASASVDFSDLAPDLVSLFPVLTEIKELRSSSSGTEKPDRPGTFEDRTNIFELLARALARIAASEPLVLLLEDLHAATVSNEATQYIVRRLGPTPTLIVATYRSSEVAKRHPVIKMLDSFQGDRRFVSLRLEPLLPSEHATLLRSLLGSSHLDRHLVEKLYEATEGNPHVTKELLGSLVELGRVVRSETDTWMLRDGAGIAADTLPETIRQTIDRRIKKLPRNLRAILSIASVLGKRFEHRDLALLVGSPADVEAALDRLVRDGLVEEVREARSGIFAFSSGLLCDVLYSQLPRPRRRALHRQYAEELERRNAARLERVYAELFYHYSCADVPERVVAYGLRLARKSLGAFSADDAIRTGKRVLGALEQGVGTPSLEAEVRQVLADAHRMVGNTEGALEELRAAALLCEHEKATIQVATIMASAAETAWEGRKAEEARHWVEKGLSAARASGEGACLRRLLSLGATLANLRAEYGKATEYLNEVDKLGLPERASSADVPRGGKLVVALSATIQAAHPADIKLDEEQEVFANVFETLVASDSEGRLVPGLSEKWEALDEGRAFLFAIREGVRMHDGTELAAPEIKRSLERAIRRSADEMPPAYAAIRGVDEFVAGQVDDVTGIRVPSVRELAIELKEALPIYPALLTDILTCIAGEESGAATTGTPQLVGTGPFKLGGRSSQGILLHRNPSYWKGIAPLLDAIEFRTGVSASDIALGLQAGEFDIARDLLPEDLEYILRDKRFRGGFVEAPKKNVHFLLFNQASAHLQSAAVRRAMSGVVRVHDMVCGALGRFAQPADGLLPPGILGHDPGSRRPSVAPEKALQVLRSAGMDMPIRLRASVHPCFQDRFASLTKSLFSLWLELGIELSIATPGMSSYLDSLESNADIDLVLSRWVADYHDPDNFTHTLFHSGLGVFRHYYSSAELDRILEDARRETSPSAREKLYRRSEELLAETAFVLPLFHDLDYRVANPRVCGLELHGTPPYVNYCQVGKRETAPPLTTREARGGIIQIPVAGRVSSLDPSRTTTAVQSDVIPTVFETLTSQAEGARIVPWLASEFHSEEGGRKFWFHLREDVRFHDGRRLTARDVRASFERLLQDVESESRWLLAPIRGAANLLDRQRTELAGFEILSTSAFSIELDRPVSFFPALLAYAPASIVPEGSHDFGCDWRGGCAGTGPFRVVRFDPGRILELEANPYYWRKGYPRSDGLVFTFDLSPQEILSGFRSGHFSLAWNLLPPEVETLRRDSDVVSNYLQAPRLSTYYMAFNIHQGPLASESARRALVRALDVEALVRRNIGRLAIPARSLIPPGLLGHDPSRSAPLTSSDRSLLGEEAELTGMIHSIYGGPYAQFARDLLHALRGTGFRPRIAETKADSPKALESATVDFVLQRWFPDYPDADTFVHGLLHSADGLLGRFCGVPEVDRLIERGRRETDPGIRHEIYREIEEIVARRALLLPLFHELAYRFARPEVAGVELTMSLQAVPYEKMWIRQ